MSGNSSDALSPPPANLISENLLLRETVANLRDQLDIVRRQGRRQVDDTAAARQEEVDELRQQIRILRQELERIRAEFDRRIAVDTDRLRAERTDLVKTVEALRQKLETVDGNA